MYSPAEKIGERGSQLHMKDWNAVINNVAAAPWDKIAKWIKQKVKDHYKLKNWERLNLVSIRKEQKHIKGGFVSGKETDNWWLHSRLNVRVSPILGSFSVSENQWMGTTAVLGPFPPVTLKGHRAKQHHVHRKPPLVSSFFAYSSEHKLNCFNIIL